MIRYVVLATVLIGGTAIAQRRAPNMQAVPAESPMGWFNADNYPPDALRASRQGRVIADLGIDTTGAVVSCEVRQSSGTSSLDQGTCEAARTQGRFNPATDKRGRLTTGHYLLSVRWELPDGPAPATDIAGIPATDGYAIRVYFSADGVLASCEVLRAPTKGSGDPCANAKALLGDKVRTMTRAGKPIPYSVTTRLTEEVVAGD